MRTMQAFFIIIVKIAHIHVTIDSVGIHVIYCMYDNIIQSKL
ncbi:hypothetical protein [Virgibacillus pantothenticus]|nr:hypothetical protein [Virgibacillus pantothenticus]